MMLYPGFHNVNQVRGRARHRVRTLRRRVRRRCVYRCRCNRLDLDHRVDRRAVAAV